MNQFLTFKQKKMYIEEDLREAFNAAREFNSADGVVEVQIVIAMGGDMSDLEPIHLTYDEWFKQFKKKLKWRKNICLR